MMTKYLVYAGALSRSQAHTDRQTNRARRVCSYIPLFQSREGWFCGWLEGSMDCSAFVQKQAESTKDRLLRKRGSGRVD